MKEMGMEKLIIARENALVEAWNPLDDKGKDLFINNDVEKSFKEAVKEFGKENVILLNRNEGFRLPVKDSKKYEYVTLPDRDLIKPFNFK